MLLREANEFEWEPDASLAFLWAICSIADHIHQDAVAQGQDTYWDGQSGVDDSLLAAISWAKQGDRQAAFDALHRASQYVQDYAEYAAMSADEQEEAGWRPHGWRG